jgi:hypothetical protein
LAGLAGSFGQIAGGDAKGGWVDWRKPNSKIRQDWQKDGGRTKKQNACVGKNSEIQVVCKFTI